VQLDHRRERLHAESDGTGCRGAAVFGWLVFGRYVLNDTPTWVEQLALLLVIVITFLGSATLVHEDRHLGVTFIRDALPRRLRISARLLGDVSLAAFGLIMALVCSEVALPRDWFAWHPVWSVMCAAAWRRSTSFRACFSVASPARRLPTSAHWARY